MQRKLIIILLVIGAMSIIAGKGIAWHSVAAMSGACLISGIIAFIIGNMIGSRLLEREIDYYRSATKKMQDSESESSLKDLSVFKYWNNATIAIVTASVFIVTSIILKMFMDSNMVRSIYGAVAGFLQAKGLFVGLVVVVFGVVIGLFRFVARRKRYRHERILPDPEFGPRISRKNRYPSVDHVYAVKYILYMCIATLGAMPLVMFYVYRTLNKDVKQSLPLWAFVVLVVILTQVCRRIIDVHDLYDGKVDRLLMTWVNPMLLLALVRLAILLVVSLPLASFDGGAFRNLVFIGVELYAIIELFLVYCRIQLVSNVFHDNGSGGLLGEVDGNLEDQIRDLLRRSSR